MIPTATYRLQFRNGMTFDRAAALVPYLKNLGISHLYASPIFTATKASTHGYDVTDANEIEPSIGGREGFERLVAELKAQGLGLIIDIVPNHMASSLENAWWRDVLEYGKESRYARHFDIDWSRRLTLPFLGDTFDAVLENGEIAIKPDPATGKPAFAYYDNYYPLAPATWQGREAEILALTDKAAIADLHERQPWKLMSWRDAARSLSYRRFFEVTGLVGMRVEDKTVFDDTHRLILELVRTGAVDDEQIDNLRQAYETVKGAPVDMRAELRAAKLLMVDRNFEGEFTRLLALALSIASELQIAQEESVVRQALRELLIAFPVYRTYGTAEGLPPTDICLLHRIVERVKTLETPPQPEALTFLSRLLTGDVPASSQEEATQFRVRFQQLTGPLMAKSVEDTLFFRQNMGLALNEVGAEPVTHHFSIERFHHEMKTRQARQPDALSGTSTHDTKRGEDARARLYTLTEAPEQWSECLARWRQMNQTHVKFLNDGTAPKSADTWMLYQALTGVWPPVLQPQDETGLNALKTRFEAFVEKALREAKLRTDWVDSNEAYETAMLDYARYLLAPDNQTFLQDFYRSLQPFIRAGLVNSLTQTVIKLTAPGVPDIYQGSEALNFSLVDPDNRREPDFATLAQQLDQLTPGVFSREESWLNGQVNQYVTAALLRLRQQNHELFRFGDYIPLRAVGQRADKVIAYARVNHDDALIVVAPRLVFAECDGLLSQSHSGFWSGTDIIIPGQLNQHRYRNVLTQERLMPGERLSLASHQGGVLVLMSD
ncbi:malto-oligosyltrehalose synthase [Salmonella enterica]|nr:malto-oligosyltrehalose synthase [Salmonella enterica]EDD4506740.1 malto-oligosyltrehalose synthase [Salmonella enterica subsp. enterica serovar Typhimurium]